MGRERRRFQRMESLLDVRYFSKAGDINGYSLTKDVSEEGLGLPVSGKIPSGMMLEVVIKLRGEEGREFPVTCRVVWSKRNFEHWKSRYSAGLKFLEIAQADKAQLLYHAGRNKWIKGDFERALEEGKIPVLGRDGDFVM